MEELNKKIAEWCGLFGFREIPENWPKDLYWSENLTIVAPKFTESLDACFKYIVPKLEYYDIYGGGNDHVVIINHWLKVVLF